MDERPQVEIRYCVPCGYYAMASWIGGEFDREFPSKVAIAFVPSAHGELKVSINGAVVYDYMTISKRAYPDYEAVTRMKMTMREMVPALG